MPVLLRLSHVLSINGEDLTGLPLLERKRRLVRVVHAVDCRLLYLITWWNVAPSYIASRASAT